MCINREKEITKCSVFSVDLNFKILLKAEFIYWVSHKEMLVFLNYWAECSCFSAEPNNMYNI